MYVSRPHRSWTQRLLGSARTIAAVILTAVLALALFAHWNEATATNAPAFILPNDAAVGPAISAIVADAEARFQDALERRTLADVADSVDGTANWLH